MPDKKIDVVGIGNAIVDVIAQGDDAFLEAQKLAKGTMTLIDEAQAEALYRQIGPAIETSGGSAANTLAGLSSLGGRGGFIGKVRDDQLGAIFRHDIRSVGTVFDTPSATEGPSTARCMIVVTPDAQRTMSTYLGASVHFGPDDLDHDLIASAKVLYLEGYLWDKEAATEAFVAAAETAKANGVKLALSLSDPFCVDRHRDGFRRLVAEHVDVLFANESEILSLYRTDSFEQAVEAVRGEAQVAALTRSEHGSVVVAGEQRVAVPAVRLGGVIDTTGAGDLYAAGFLFGWTHQHNLEVCARLGSLAAAECISHVGPRPQRALHELVPEILT